MNRRQFLFGAGGATALLAGGVTWRAQDRGVFSYGEGPAFDVWKSEKSSVSEGPAAFVRAAILASNPHNTQPWLFRAQKNTLEIFADTSRHLGAMDPYLREMHFGLGCALENIKLVAATHGFKTDIRYASYDLTKTTERQKPILAATANFTPQSPQASELAKAIPLRRTNRAPYQERALGPKHLQAMQSLAASDKDVKLLLLPQSEGKGFTQLTTATIEATQAIIKDKVMAHDSYRWFRNTWDEVQQHRDGPNLFVAGLSPFISFMAKILPPLSEEQGHQGWLRSTKSTLAATPVMGMLLVRSLYDAPQTLKAGQLWQKLNLWATTQGLAAQPINQAVEAVDRGKQLSKVSPIADRLTSIVNDKRWQPTFIFRMGHPLREVPHSPRRDPKTIML